MILIDNILKDKTPLVKLYDIGEYKPTKKKCLIVGSCNESLKNFNLDKFIKDYDGDIIAIQSMYEYVNKIRNCLKIYLYDWQIKNIKQWNKNENYDDINIYKKYFTFTFIKYLNNCFVREHKNILGNRFDSFVNYHFTTGFITILFGLYNYDICEICGFGYTNVRYKNNNDPTFYYEVTKDKKHKGEITHDYNLEHSFYDEWQNLLKDKFYRCEEKYLDYKNNQYF